MFLGLSHGLCIWQKVTAIWAIPFTTQVRVGAVLQRLSQPSGEGGRAVLELAEPVA
ncbi:hypothetical protein SDC9_190629 [bioreactor metagenome]|uniref:Uncharacterized protein n=1 Tax=bioreactor metagenome TaxID=1076179 RepID=A0A645HW27_9ZZZZ